MDTLEDDAVMLMRKRVYDMAGMLGKTVKVCTLPYRRQLQTAALQ